MRCDHAVPLLSGLIDNTLGPLARLGVRRHLRDCDACTARLDELRAMQAALRTKLPVHRAPPGLAARVGSALSREAPLPVVVQPWRPAAWFAGTGVAGAFAGVALTLLVLHGGEDTAGSVVAGHIRSLQATHLTDVPTSDQHTVKPWLSARLDVSPPVRDLTDQGFVLVGGRLDYVAGHPAAAVVYRRAQHVINLFAWASNQGDAGFRQEARQGFNVVTWRRAGITYYAVSDVEMDQLAQFARLVAE
jgi:anti-sigma factor RsiW